MLKPRGFFVLVALLAAGIAFFGLTAVAQEAEIDEKARKVVESMSAFYSGLDTMFAQAAVEMRMSAQGTKQELNVTYDLACDRSGRFSLHLKEKQTDMFVASAGGKLQAYIRMTNRMLVADAPSVDTIVRSSGKI